MSSPSLQTLQTYLNHKKKLRELATLCSKTLLEQALDAGGALAKNPPMLTLRDEGEGFHVDFGTRRVVFSLALTEPSEAANCRILVNLHRNQEYQMQDEVVPVGAFTMAPDHPAWAAAGGNSKPVEAFTALVLGHINQTLTL